MRATSISVRPFGLLGLALVVAWGRARRTARCSSCASSSDLTVPDAMDGVRVVVTHAGKQLQSLPFSLVSGTHTLPLQVGLLSPSGGGADVEIDVTGSLGSTFVVEQTAVTGFVKNKSVVLDIFLAAACVGFDCHDPDKTCTQGQVVRRQDAAPRDVARVRLHAAAILRGRRRRGGRRGEREATPADGQSAAAARAAARAAAASRGPAGRAASRRASPTRAPPARRAPPSTRAPRRPLAPGRSKTASTASTTTATGCPTAPIQTARRRRCASRARRARSARP